MSIFTKLLNAKANFDKVLKSADNPFFRSKFADLNSIMDAVVPALTEQGLLLLQPIEGDKVVTMIIDSESGEKVVSYLTIPATLTDPQKIGGAVTYFRRYGLQSLLGLQAEDDDGNTASDLKSKPEPKINGVETKEVAPAAGSTGFKRALGNGSKPTEVVKTTVPPTTEKAKPNGATKVWDDV